MKPEFRPIRCGTGHYCWRPLPDGREEWWWANYDGTPQEFIGFVPTSWSKYVR